MDGHSPMKPHGTQSAVDVKQVKFQFNDNIAEGFKSSVFLKMESMIEKVKLYHEDFKGTRIPIYEKKF